MEHLAQYPAVRAGDAFDRQEGTVGVPVLIHGHIAFRIAVLGRDLSVFRQFFQPFLIGNEASFAVGGRIDIDAAQIRQGQPGALVGYDFHIIHAGDVTADGVEGQCRCVCRLFHDLASRHQSQFDQGLETVTDTQSQAISLIQKLLHGLFDLSIAEGSCKELGRAVRFVTR